LIASHTNPATVLSVCAAEFQCTTAETRHKEYRPSIIAIRKRDKPDGRREFYTLTEADAQKLMLFLLCAALINNK
jgi:hypothetical protein